MEGNYNINIKKAEPAKSKQPGCWEWLLMLLGIATILSFMGFKIHIFGW